MTPNIILRLALVVSWPISYLTGQIPPIKLTNYFKTADITDITEFDITDLCEMNYLLLKTLTGDLLTIKFLTEVGGGCQLSRHSFYQFVKIYTFCE